MFIAKGEVELEWSGRCSAMKCCFEASCQIYRHRTVYCHGVFYIWGINSRISTRLAGPISEEETLMLRGEQL